MIIIAGSISILPEKRQACLDASMPLQAATRADEPGCLAYVFSADPCEPGIISVYELWEDAPTLAAHFKHSNYTDMRGVFAQHGITGEFRAGHIERSWSINEPNVIDSIYYLEPNLSQAAAGTWTFPMTFPTIFT